MKMKQTFALLCAGAMVITGSAFPVNVQASADWVWNEEVSESGYKKVPYTELRQQRIRRRIMNQVQVKARHRPERDMQSMRQTE